MDFVTSDYIKTMIKDTGGTLEVDSSFIQENIQWYRLDDMYVVDKIAYYVYECR